MVKCSAILLAAGKSSRMGSLKALLEWKGTSLLQYQLFQFNQSKIDQMIVVLGYQSNKLLPYLKNFPVQLVWNEHYEKGKTESIKRGILSINENTDCFIIAAVDQPVNQLLINEMIDQYSQTNSKIVIPIYEGKRGHPTLFSAELREELLQINEETSGLKSILQKRKNDINEWVVTDDSVLFNFNTLKDYEKSIIKGGPKQNESF